MARHRLCDIGATYGGLTGKSKADFGRGTASFVTFMEVINSTRLHGRSLESVKVAKSERQNSVARGDLLFNGSSETPEEVALSAVVDFDPAPDTYLNSFCFGYRLKRSDVADPTYLAYFFRSSTGRRLVSPLAQGATRYNIAKTKFRNVIVTLPGIDRQREIVDALTDTDDLIATVSRSIAKKQGIKQGMMQQLLTGKTRLPGFGDEWVEASLGELAQIMSGGTPKSSVPAYWDGGIAWCTPTDITRESSRFLRTTERTISKEGLEASAAQLLPKGSLLLCTRATIGELKISLGAITTNQGFKSLIPRLGVSSEFLYYKMLDLKEELTGYGTGSTFLEVSKRDVSALRFKTPSTEEQKAIAAVLTDADDELDALQVRLAKAKSVKQGMMQVLLTGRTRLSVEEGAV